MSRTHHLVAMLVLCLGACRSNLHSSGNSDAIPFDAHLWRAARQTVGFLPIESADPIDGIVETGWGMPRGGVGNRYKVRVEIDYTQIYSRALAVTVRHQVMTNDGWREVDQDGIAAVQLARLIGDEAGQLRLEENRIK